MNTSKKSYYWGEWKRKNRKVRSKNHRPDGKHKPKEVTFTA